MAVKPASDPLKTISWIDWITSLVCFGLGFAVILDTRSYPSSQGQGFGQGPGFYPELLAWLLVGFGGLILLNRLRVNGDTVNGPDHASVRPINRLVIEVLAVCAVLMLIMRFVGFFVSGSLLTLLIIRLIRGGTGSEYWVPDLVFTVGIIGLVYLLFDVFLGIQLPAINLPG